MAEVNQALFRVLRQLGADEDQAFTGASHDDLITALRSDVTEMKSELKLLKWMVGAVGIVSLGNLWLSYGILARLIDLASAISALAARVPQ